MYNDIKQIPADTYNLTKHYDERLDRLYDEVTRSNVISECPDLQNILDDNVSLIERGGFDYLNSLEAGNIRDYKFPK